MRKISERLLLFLCIIGAASLLALTLLMGMPGSARAADPIVQLEFFDEEHGDNLILIGSSLAGDEKIESCGEEYTVTWAAEPDGRMKTSFQPQGLCDSATVVTPWQKEFVDSSDNWKAESGFLIREGWPVVEITFSDTEDKQAVLVVATNLEGDESYETCDNTWPVEWQSLEDGRHWMEFGFGDCGSFTIVTSLQKVFHDESVYWDTHNGYMVRVGFPTTEIEVQETDGGNTVILFAPNIFGTEPIESCGEQFEVEWTQEPNGERLMTSFTPKQGCGSFTVVTSGVKQFVDNSASWDPENGYMLRSVWPSQPENPEEPGNPQQPIAEIEFFDEHGGNTLVFIGSNLSGNEKIESCGQSYTTNWTTESDGRLKTIFALIGNCDSATVITPLQKTFIDSSANWGTRDGFVVREFWPSQPEEPENPEEPGTPGNPGTPQQPVAEIEFFDENGGNTLVFIGSNLTGSEQIESCGQNYSVEWTEEADGRWKTRFELNGTCDSATVITQLQKTFIDSSDNWGIKEGFVVREVALKAVIEFFDENGGNTLVFIGSNLTGSEQIESCGQNYSVDWTLEADGRFKASFTPTGTCESATVVTTLVKEWIDSSEFWDVEEGFVVKNPSVDPTPSFPNDVHLPYVRR